MLLALNTIRKICRGTMYIETMTKDYDYIDEAIATYHRADTCGGDSTNFWSVNRRCIMDMLYDTSFDVVRDEVWPGRILVETRSVYRSESDWKMGMAYTKPA